MIFFDISLLILKLIEFRRSPLKVYSLEKRMSLNTEIMALINLI